MYLIPVDLGSGSLRGGRSRSATWPQKGPGPFSSDHGNKSNVSSSLSSSRTCLQVNKDPDTNKFPVVPWFSVWVKDHVCRTRHGLLSTYHTPSFDVSVGPDAKNTLLGTSFSLNISSSIQIFPGWVLSLLESLKYGWFRSRDRSTHGGRGEIVGCLGKW